MAGFQLRRFTDAAILRRTDHALLLRLLEPHRDWLEARSVRLVAPRLFDYDALARALADPGDDPPEPLFDALFFVDETSAPEMYEDLLDLARDRGVALGDAPDLSCADLAVRVWLDDAEALQRLHAERFAVRARRFDHFPCAATRIPRMRAATDILIQTLQDDLNAFFETRKKGRGTRVFPFVKDDQAWLLIRHGERMRREGAVDGERSTSVFYRPEQYDVIVYNPDLGELAIHAETRGEKREYCKLLGRHFFGDASAFDPDPAARFTLEPILRDGRACLACSDIEGMEEVRLVELQWRHDISQRFVEVQRADDVFAALAEIRRAIPSDVEPLKAVWKVRFAGAARERRMAYKPPNVAEFERDSDAARLLEWATRRGFAPRMVRVVGNVS